jgi:hypothetical protein
MPFDEANYSLLLSLEKIINPSFGFLNVEEAREGAPLELIPLLVHDMIHVVMQHLNLEFRLEHDSA